MHHGTGMKKPARWMTAEVDDAPERCGRFRADQVKRALPPWAGIHRAVVCLCVAAAVAACGRGGGPGTSEAKATEAGRDDANIAATAREDPEFDARFEAYYLEALAAGDARPVSDADTRFVRSAAIDREMSKAFLGRYRVLETVTRDELGTLVGSGAALSALGHEIAARGMDPDDLADVAAFHRAVHWAIANRRTVPEASLEDISATLRPRLLDEMVDAGGGDAARQRLADAYAIRAAIRSNEYATLLRRDDGQALRRYSDAVHRDFLARFEVDLRRTDPSGRGR